MAEAPARVSVLMPTFKQAALIPRAIESLLEQSMPNWELVIVDDGSPDDTQAVVKPYLADPRIRGHRLRNNLGLGTALNQALARARAPLIAYLPSDDVYYADHLASLAECLHMNPDAALAYSGVRREERLPGRPPLANRTSTGQIEGYPLQLVQVMHRLTQDRWLEREELVTDDLELMFWSKMRHHGTFSETGRISCEWVDQPRQRHRVIREPFGGINPYRSYYGVSQPLRFHSSTGNPTDEVEHYRRFRQRPDTPPAEDGLKILLVGELAYNPERVLALEERGHKLYGLWMSDPHWFNMVGPVPFGHVEDLPKKGWRDAVRQVRPDVIYAMLNWITVPFAHEVLTADTGVPFVWHFKEGPFDCVSNGTWPLLVDLHTLSDGQIYLNQEVRDWFAMAIPGVVSNGHSMLLDGDLPKRDWFTSQRSPLLSESDGKIHTVVPGAPVGLEPPIVSQLAQQDVHIHFYGNFLRGMNQAWVEEVQTLAPEHLHLHPQVDQENWVSELSQYDAGWLHLVESGNRGDLRAAAWPDLNYAARLPTLVAAGLPLIQYDNLDATVAMQSLSRRLDIGLFYRDAEQLARELRDKARMAQLRDNVWRHRDTFTFDHHADRLVEFFRQAISRRPARRTVPRLSSSVTAPRHVFART